MSQADGTKWQNKYAKSKALRGIDPDQELIHYADILPQQGLALDLACGLGKNSLALAQRGLRVHAVDISQNGLDRLMHAARSLGLESAIQPLCVDLDEYSLMPSSYDLIVVVRYLERALFAALQAALKPGGMLLYKTFNRRILESRPGFRAEFTIESTELVDSFSGLEVIVDGRDDADSEYAFLLARKSTAN